MTVFPRLARLFALACGLFLASPFAASAAGLTVVTHGFNANVTDWVIPMCDQMAQYRSFPGSNSSIYQISITRTGSTYYSTAFFLDGVTPSNSVSGEILVALDWSTLSSGSVPTTAVATQAVVALLATNLISDLKGHALAELPMHFVGHSRGGSLITEMARVLGAQGLWVDHVSTLDPHPVSAFGDPTMKNYANIFFADNQWQNLGDGLFVPNGQSISGAYNRQLTSLNGGYSSSHSDAHLWYHGTIDLRTPASDTSATITSTERANWWVPSEAAGTNCGFLYSLIGGGDRLSSFNPVGTGPVSSGVNKMWDFGAGLAANRTALTMNNGLWPNLIRLNLTGPTNLAPGDPIPLLFYHQYGSNTATSANLRFFLDPDSNPYNKNEMEILQTTVAGTGVTNVFPNNLTLNPGPALMPAGTFFVSARISDGVRTRYLYAPQKLTISTSQAAPYLTFATPLGGAFRGTVHGVAGQTFVLQGSTNLINWTPLWTNTFTGTAANFADFFATNSNRGFYRAQLISP